MNRLVEGLGVKGNTTYFEMAGARLFSGGYLALTKLLNHDR
jgi:hypothetical protein